MLGLVAPCAGGTRQGKGLTCAPLLLVGMAHQRPCFTAPPRHSENLSTPTALVSISEPSQQPRLLLKAWDVLEEAVFALTSYSLRERYACPTSATGFMMMWWTHCAMLACSTKRQSNGGTKVAVVSILAAHSDDGDTTGLFIGTNMKDEGTRISYSLIGKSRRRRHSSVKCIPPKTKSPCNPDRNLPFSSP